jgi:hypothetical protein
MNPPHAPIHFPPLPKGIGPLWFSVLGAPAAWALHLQSIYSLAHSACVHDRRALLQVLTAVLLLVALSCAAVSAVYRRGQDRFPEQRDRVHFLALLGTLSGMLYAVVIVAQGIATLMLDPCAS